MYQALYNFFANTLFGSIPDNYYIKTVSWTIGGKTITLYQWLCNTLSIVMLVVIFVICLLFIWKIIKVVGRLFSGA